MTSQRDKGVEILNMYTGMALAHVCVCVCACVCVFVCGAPASSLEVHSKTQAWRSWTDVHNTWGILS